MEIGLICEIPSITSFTLRNGIPLIYTEQTLRKIQMSPFEDNSDFEKESMIDFNRISKVITIIDSRQERLQNLMVEILGKLGMDSKYRYLGYEPVILSQRSLDGLGISGRIRIHYTCLEGKVSTLKQIWP